MDFCGIYGTAWSLEPIGLVLSDKEWHATKDGDLGRFLMARYRNMKEIALFSTLAMLPCRAYHILLLAISAIFREHERYGNGDIRVYIWIEGDPELDSRRKSKMTKRGTLWMMWYGMNREEKDMDEDG